jgi:hypothetical protein
MTKDQDLARCKGYRVETHDGGIGGVAAVLSRAGPQKRGVLLVHTGLLSCGLNAIPFDEVETIDPGERRVLLRGLSRTMREGAPSRARDRIVSRA